MSLKHSVFQEEFSSLKIGKILLNLTRFISASLTVYIPLMSIRGKIFRHT